MPRMRKGLGDWVSATRATRQELQRKGITNAESITKAINRSLGNKDTVDPQGTTIRPKRRK